ncbi:MAG: imidazole glycerol phosphate synthase subunit HisH [Gammaproteobacteria bacterium CG11_big_fil_rev_8_21_14_0_20_46_22]|nr:MAG: imidazole glycerol phosphate synthase subunit HisH [Gammaproteobacteria bacterium CG12_big_fil_rev_8_21_14_0_65_46_12]PIR12122.1 MAG: imidazole glycerol phosphate synthase subunit HisH [Gammaproteobacteria bacterium CG11_big_fil_rev_8_21_14_0_20_46_22]
MKVVIVDYGVGNIGSFLNMFKKIGVAAVLSKRKEDIYQADKLILPGVGAFDYGMTQLENTGLLEIINTVVLEGETPILGICLGMQLLMESSEEGQKSGLAWIKGRVKKFNFANQRILKVPHMGWNVVKPFAYNNLFYGFEGEDIRFYFVHSYYTACEDQGNALAVTDYGGMFPSAICADHIYGVQFHPEKSHRFGMRLLKNFVERC